MSQWQIFIGGSFICCGLRWATATVPDMFAASCGLRLEKLASRKRWFSSVMPLATAAGAIAGSALQETGGLDLVGLVVSVIVVLSISVMIFWPNLEKRPRGNSISDVGGHNPSNLQQPLLPRKRTASFGTELGWGLE